MYRSYQQTKAPPKRQPTIDYDEVQPYVPSQPTYQTIKEEPGRILGHVKIYNQEKGFGFITREDTRKDVFFHRSELGSTQPQKGQRASFKLMEDRRGIKAINIKFY